MVSAVPEREVAAAAAAATTAARDVRPKSSRPRRRRRPLQRLAPGPLVSRTRARVEEQGRREARLRSLSRPLGRRRPSTSRRRGLQPSSRLLGRARPQAGRVRQRQQQQQRGSRLAEDSAAAEVPSRPFQPDALAAALRCRR